MKEQYIISSMGTGNKLNPAMLEVSDIYKTSVCPLTKVMRREFLAGLLIASEVVKDLWKKEKE